MPLHNSLYMHAVSVLCSLVKLVQMSIHVEVRLSLGAVLCLCVYVCVFTGDSGLAQDPDGCPLLAGAQDGYLCLSCECVGAETWGAAHSREEVLFGTAQPEDKR